MLGLHKSDIRAVVWRGIKKVGFDAGGELKYACNAYFARVWELLGAQVFIDPL